MKIESLTKLHSVLEAITKHHDNIKTLQVLRANDSVIEICLEFDNISSMEWRVYGIVVKPEHVCVLYVNKKQVNRVEHYKYVNDVDIYQVVVSLLEGNDKGLELYKK